MKMVIITYGRGIAATHQFTAVVAMSRKLPFAAPCKTKTPKPITLIMSMSRPTVQAKFHNNRPGVAAPKSSTSHMGEVFDWRSFYSGVLLACTRTTDPERSSATYYMSIDAVCAKDVPFREIIDISRHLVSYPSKPIN
jgi:hypothetical protein